MKKTLLIVTGLMALGLPAQAVQLTQVNHQADQAKLSQQAEPGQMTTGFCDLRKKKGC